MKIPKEYGGLGFTQREYGEVMKLITSRDGNLIALLSAHQSIGVPQPLKLFGTKEQKKKYLPRLARGAISAFALTEPDVGSDPANLVDDRGADARGRLHPQRREALVHQRHDRRALRRHGAAPRHQEDLGLHRREGVAGRRGRASAATSWA